MSGELLKQHGMARHQAENLLGNYRLTPATLYNKLDPLWIPKPFLLQASMKIAQAVAKPNGRLIISWPPRHGKSRLATIATPIWSLENFPEKDIILSTYGADLSTDFGREVRDIFRRNETHLDERIRADVKSVGRFMTTKGGGMLNVGLGGAITGKGADLFIIDDYIKTMEEALSQSKRDKDWEWFTGTAYHRLEPGGTMIIIATRWHSDDLIGRIIKEFGTTDEGGDWDLVKFKAISDGDPDDPTGRGPNEALFEERFSLKDLEDRKKVLGTLFFNALYQQEPDDEEGKLTDRDWIEIIDHGDLDDDPRNIVYYRVWDIGGGKGKETDPTVGSLIMFNTKTRETTILDVYRERKSPSVTENNIKKRGRDDGVDTKVIVEQEPGASGKVMVNHIDVNVLPDHKVIASPATTSKVVRAQPFLAACEEGKVRLLKGKWNDAWLDEFEEFPFAANDDQVDTASMGYNEVFKKKPGSATWGREKPNASKADARHHTDPNEPHNLYKSVTTGLVWGRRK